MSRDVKHSTGSASVQPATGATIRNRLRPVVVSFGVLLLAGAMFFAGRLTKVGTRPNFHQLTFQRGRVLGARFSPDGQTILYSAEWNGESPDVYSTRSDRPGARSLGMPGGELLAVSAAGDVAILSKITMSLNFADTGTLAIAPLSGGAPRDVAENVQFADFSPDGTQLAIIRDLMSHGRLEYPVGKPLYEAGAWLGNCRISPRGDQIAFVEHPGFNDTFGSLLVTDTAGHRKTLEKDWFELLDLAWSPKGDEIWFTGSSQTGQRSLYAVKVQDGKTRPLLDAPGNGVLKDVFRDGKVLLVRENLRRERSGFVGNEAKLRDFSWFDWTNVVDLSPDGKTFVFYEAGIGGGKDFSLFLRKTDGSPAVFLGPGYQGALSPDGKWVLANSAHPPSRMFLYPTGAGETRQITHDKIDHYSFAWLPDGKHVIFSGSEPGHSGRLYRMDLEDGSTNPISGEGFFGSGQLSPDGKFILTGCVDFRPCIFQLDSGDSRPIPGLRVDDVPVQWSDDGQSVYTFRFGALPAQGRRIDILTGSQRPWKNLAPADLAGVHGLSGVSMTRDGRVCLFSYLRTLSDLYLAQSVQ